MKNTRLLYLFFFILLFQITACRDKQDDPKPLTRSELLTSKTWRIDKILGRAFGVELDLTNDPLLGDYVSEYKDAQFSFRPDGTCTITSPADTIAATWALADNDTKLVLNPGGADEDTWDIVELNNNTAEFSSNKTNPLTGTPMLLVLELK
jgi:hypothetical protein